MLPPTPVEGRAIKAFDRGTPPPFFALIAPPRSQN